MAKTKRPAGKEFRDGTLGEALDSMLDGDAITSLADGSTGSTPDDAIAAIGDTTNANESGAINANFRELLEKVNAILAALRAASIIKS